MTVDPLLAWVASGSLALLFALACIHKLAHWEELQRTLADYALAPRHLTVLLGGGLVAAELTVTIGLLMGLAAAAAGAAALLLLYASAMAANLLRGRRLADCGCGAAGQPLSWGLVVRNLLLASVALPALLPAAERPLGWLDGFTGLAAVAAAAALYAGADRLMAAWHNGVTV